MLRREAERAKSDKKVGKHSHPPRQLPSLTFSASVCPSKTRQKLQQAAEEDASVFQYDEVRL